jgi:hypothetical protein
MAPRSLAQKNPTGTPTSSDCGDAPALTVSEASVWGDARGGVAAQFRRARAGGCRARRRPQAPRHRRHSCTGGGRARTRHDVALARDAARAAPRPGRVGFRHVRIGHVGDRHLRDRHPPDRPLSRRRARRRRWCGAGRRPAAGTTAGAAVAPRADGRRPRRRRGDRRGARRRCRPARPRRPPRRRGGDADRRRLRRARPDPGGPGEPGAARRPRAHPRRRAAERPAHPPRRSGRLRRRSRRGRHRYRCGRRCGCTGRGASPARRGPRRDRRRRPSAVGRPPGSAGRFARRTAPAGAARRRDATCRGGPRRLPHRRRRLRRRADGDTPAGRRPRGGGGDRHRSSGPRSGNDDRGSPSVWSPSASSGWRACASRRRSRASPAASSRRPCRSPTSTCPSTPCWCRCTGRRASCRGCCRRSAPSTTPPTSSTSSCSSRPATARRSPPSSATPLVHRFDVVMVPRIGPLTKPKALGVGLALARGSLVTIFDAEDRPDPDQLRRAAGTFAAAGADLACVQARLATDHAGDTWITAMFALEYAMLFDAVLPWLARYRLPFLLGGTSNHFRRSALHAVGGWDAWNVTEDADLAVRLARRGFTSTVIASTTHEEAPLEVAAWLKQRARWYKGWLQTTLVHGRDLAGLTRSVGVEGLVALALQLIGALVTVVAYPVSWFLVAGYTVGALPFRAGRQLRRRPALRPRRHRLLRRPGGDGAPRTRGAAHAAERHPARGARLAAGLLVAARLRAGARRRRPHPPPALLGEDRARRGDPAGRATERRRGRARGLWHRRGDGVTLAPKHRGGGTRMIDLRNVAGWIPALVLAMVLAGGLAAAAAVAAEPRSDACPEGRACPAIGPAPANAAASSGTPRPSVETPVGEAVARNSKSLRWNIQNRSGRRLELQLYSADRNWVWPSANRRLSPAGQQALHDRHQLQEEREDLLWRLAGEQHPDLLGRRLPRQAELPRLLLHLRARTDAPDQARVVSPAAAGPPLPPRSAHSDRRHRAQVGDDCRRRRRASASHRSGSPSAASAWRRRGRCPR